MHGYCNECSECSKDFCSAQTYTLVDCHRARHHCIKLASRTSSTSRIVQGQNLHFRHTDGTHESPKQKRKIVSHIHYVVGTSDFPPVCVSLVGYHYWQLHVCRSCQGFTNVDPTRPFGRFESNAMGVYAGQLLWMGYLQYFTPRFVDFCRQLPRILFVDLVEFGCDKIAV